MDIQQELRRAERLQRELAEAQRRAEAESARIYESLWGEAEPVSPSFIGTPKSEDNPLERLWQDSITG